MSPHFDSWASVTTICSCFFYVATQQQLLMAKVQEVNANFVAAQAGDGPSTSQCGGLRVVLVCPRLASLAQVDRGCSFSSCEYCEISECFACPGQRAAAFQQGENT